MKEMESCSGNLAVSEKEKKTLECPKKFNVILHNDDVTPIGFVVEILVKLFMMDEKKAVKKVVEIQKKEKAVVGTYIRSIAEYKSYKTKECAEKAGFPLNATTEEANE